MSISASQLKKIAQLAQLELSAADQQHYQADLEKILDFVATMNVIDTHGVEPMSHPFDSELCWRNDAVSHEHSRAELLANAPQQQDGFFLVPQVIETGD